MPTDRKSTSMRLTSAAVDLLADLAADLGISQTAVVELALRDLAESRGLRKPSKQK
jgi:hypothetical protein